jgi:hypothetical protein
MGEFCDCTSWEQCRFKKSGVGFAICSGTAIMPDGSPMPDERRQIYIRAWEWELTGQPIPLPAPEPPRSSRMVVCPHRGAEVRREVCTSCGGRVEIKIFSCAIHGECTIAKQLPGVHVCDS